MSLSEEVLVKISQNVVDTLSWQDVWKARLVNNTFSREITALLIKSPQLKVKGLGFKPGYAGPQEDPKWDRFPARLKRVYLYQKTLSHFHSPCVWSTFVQGILDLPNDCTDTEETNYLYSHPFNSWDSLIPGR
ncbi:hypothetical protein N7453_007041 [Penicillium expansum]|nr:hypothetical protein N7453_007041 [Penicillium expansum]